MHIHLTTLHTQPRDIELSPHDVYVAKVLQSLVTGRFEHGVWPSAPFIAQALALRNRGLSERLAIIILTPFEGETA